MLVCQLCPVQSKFNAVLLSVSHFAMHITFQLGSPLNLLHRMLSSLPRIGSLLPSSPFLSCTIRWDRCLGDGNLHKRTV